MKQRLLARGCSAALALSLASFSTAALAQSSAQTSSQASAASERLPDEIVVTGTLIRGTAEDAALPVDVISAEELSRQGSPSVVELLKRLPVSSGVLGDTNQFDSRSQGAEGVATVNLRGLGAQRTLVLLNNRRLVPAGTGIPAVDINLLPISAIGRIEVLKDGAAATYGSDAVGGVVNFITRTNQRGLQVSGDYRFIRGSKGDYTGNISFGHNQDDFRVLFAAGFQHRSELEVSDRDWAVRPYTENPEGGWTGGGNPSTFLGLGPTGAPVTALQPDASCAVVGGFVTALNRCSTHFVPFDNIVETENRYQLYAEFTADVSDRVQFNASALYGRSLLPRWKTSPSYLLTQPPSPGIGITQAGFFVPANNPGYVLYRQQNPAALPANAIGALFPTLLFRPFLAGGNPLFDNDRGSAEGRRESNSVRFTAEVKANVSDNLDLTVGYTFHRYERLLTGYDSFGDRVQLALRGLGGPNCNIAANTPGQNGCLWLNPFGNGVPEDAIAGTPNPNFNPSVANSADLARWFFVPTRSQTDTQLQVFDATLAGETGIELPGGALAFGVGGQYRKSRYSVIYGANNNLAFNPCRDTPVNGNQACNPRNGAIAFLGTNADGAFSNDVKAAFAEIQAPILDTLNLQLAARYEKYGGAVGSTFDPKVTARWQPLPWLALRGSYGTTFRGPPEQQLSPNSVTSLQVIGGSFRPVDVFGNPNLKPETATNISGGVILEAGGFTASVDYFDYKLEGLIVGEPLVGMVNTLFANPANCANPAFAGLRNRFLFNDGGGVPGAGTCAVANISRVRTNLVNGAGVRTSGLDFIANYRGDVGPGEFGAGVTATYAIKYRTEDQLVEGLVVQPSFEAVGFLNFQTTAYPIPKWKGQAYLEYAIGDFDTRLTLNYIDSYVDQRTGPFAPRADIPGNPTLPQGKTIRSTVTADLNFRLRLPQDFALNVTVNNVLDRDPSFARLELSYDPFTGEPLGRTVKVGLSKSF